MGDGSKTRRVNIQYVSVEEAISHSIRAVKTIQSEDGDIIDCVGIYDQPAFKDPRLKNHKIIMNPSNTRGIKHNNATHSSRLQQNWHKSGTCPQGTIPITRIAYDRKKTPVSFMQYLGKEIPTSAVGAVASSTRPVTKAYKGTMGKISVWSPYVEPDDMSINYILMGYTGHSGEGDGGGDISVSIGWRVAPVEYNGDLRPRAFVAFNNNLEGTGCYNLQCTGFIQTNNRVALDSTITKISVYNGNQTAYRFAILKDIISSSWRVYMGGEEVGYYPQEVVKQFIQGDIAQWGGIVYIGGQGRKHTTSQIGSGHFPSEGENKSGKISDIYNLDLTGTPFIDPPQIGELTNPHCYDLQLLDRQESGYALYYGGPGGRDLNCV